MLPADVLHLTSKPEPEPMPTSTTFEVPLLKENCTMNDADTMFSSTTLKRKSRMASPSQKPIAKVEEASPGELALMVIINDGTLEDLMALKGMGTKSATAIIEYRKKHGVSFERAHDLVEQVGITKGTIGKLLASIGTINQ